jgi:tRNA pseudouridine38-40 synthase
LTNIPTDNKTERYFIHLSYDGSEYFGWQRQDNAVTVQQKMEEALSILLGNKTGITGCGRTDTGVHARNFYAHFNSEPLDAQFMVNLTHRLNRFLPKDIAITEIKKVKPDAHARFSAISRTYCYYIQLYKTPFGRAYAWQQHNQPDTDLMNQACDILLKTNDFTSFSKLHTQTATNICRVSEAIWQKTGNELVFNIKADRFLRNMVRAIVGTLWKVGMKQISLSDFQAIIHKKDRCEAGISVPANGLFLENVEYPEDIFIS